MVKEEIAQLIHPCIPSSARLPKSYYIPPFFGSSSGRPFSETMMGSLSGWLVSYVGTRRSLVTQLYAWIGKVSSLVNDHIIGVHVSLIFFEKSRLSLS